MKHAEHYDLIVVGSGALGTFHAYHALKAGLSVLLVEMDPRPRQATVRNFGQVVPSGMSGRWFNYGLRSTAIYSEIQQTTDISVRNNGSVYIASNEDEVELLHELKSIMDGRDYPTELLSKEACVRKWPALNSSYCSEALFFPREVSVEPDKMIFRVLAFLQEKFESLDYRPATTVVACTSATQGVKVVTHTGDTFTGTKAIVCSGSEFRILFPDHFRNSGIVVSKLHMVRTVPMPEVSLPGNILTGLTIRRYESFTECPSSSALRTPDHLLELQKYGIHILFKQATDGSIIIGDSHEYSEANSLDPLDFSLSQYIQDIMLAEAQRIVTFNTSLLATKWAGYYSQHPEKDILELDISENIHVRTAIGGKGMTSAAGYSEQSIRKLFALD